MLVTWPASLKSTRRLLVTWLLCCQSWKNCIWYERRASAFYAHYIQPSSTRNLSWVLWSLGSLAGLKISACQWCRSSKWWNHQRTSLGWLDGAGCRYWWLLIVEPWFQLFWDLNGAFKWRLTCRCYLLYPVWNLLAYFGICFAYFKAWIGRQGRWISRRMRKLSVNLLGLPVECWSVLPATWVPIKTAFQLTNPVKKSLTLSCKTN